MSALAVPFRTKKKGEESGPWKAIIPGKGIVELGSPDEGVTKESATVALQTMLASMPQPQKRARVEVPLSILETNKASKSIFETSSTNSGSEKDAQEKDAKPVTGDINKSGLAGFSNAKIGKFREAVASAIATGNVSLDRFLVGYFRDDVPILRPDQFALLSAGWELACEQYFVNGVPPAWIIILLGNALAFTNLVEGSKPKKVEEIELPKADTATVRAVGIIPGLPHD